MKKNKIILFVGAGIIIWRLLLQAIALVGTVFFPFEPSYPYSSMLRQFGSDWLVRWAGFDGVHYVTIAMNGYVGTGLIQAFFPAYPYVIRILQSGNTVISGLGISHIFLILSLTILYKLASIDSNWIRKNPFYLIFTILFLPTSFFFVSLYAESLFLFLIVSAFYFARKKNWIVATICTAIATATKVSGIFLVPALMIEAYMQSRQDFVKLPWKIWAGILLGSTGLILYMFYLYRTFGDPVFFFHVQEDFNVGRQESLILFPQVVYRYIKIFITMQKNTWMFYAVVQEFVLTMFSGAVLCWWIVRKFIYKDRSLWMARTSYVFFSLTSFFLPPLTGTFQSMPRYLLMLFPLILFFAELPKKHKKLYWSVMAVSAILLTLNTMLFFSGRWVG